MFLLKRVRKVIIITIMILVSYSSPYPFVSQMNKSNSKTYRRFVIGFNSFKMKIKWEKKEKVN